MNVLAFFKQNFYTYYIYRSIVKKKKKQSETKHNGVHPIHTCMRLISFKMLITLRHVTTIHDDKCAFNTNTIRNSLKTQTYFSADRYCP